MSAHTPGPWHVEPEKDGTCVMAGDYYITETIDAAGDDSDDTTQHANARLIASAPDLLAALQAVVANSNGDASSGYFDIPVSTVQNAIEVITKATGAAS